MLIGAALGAAGARPAGKVMRMQVVTLHRSACGAAPTAAAVRLCCQAKLRSSRRCTASPPTGGRSCARGEHCCFDASAPSNVTMVERNVLPAFAASWSSPSTELSQLSSASRCEQGLPQGGRSALLSQLQQARRHFDRASQTSDPAQATAALRECMQVWGCLSNTALLALQMHGNETYIDSQLVHVMYPYT